eukprot:28588-Lingulodinium_polyedra.AAC.1
MRSNRPCAAATARESHTHAPHARANKLARARSVRTCNLRPSANSNCFHCCLGAAWVLLEGCLGAAWVLLGCCLGAAR